MIGRPIDMSSDLKQTAKPDGVTSNNQTNIFFSKTNCTSSQMAMFLNSSHYYINVYDRLKCKFTSNLGFYYLSVLTILCEIFF